MTPDLSTWMTKQQVAAALGVSEKTVSRMAARGELGESQVRGGNGTGETPRPVYDPASLPRDRDGELVNNIGTPVRKLLAPPAVPDAPPKAKPLPLSELRFKTFLTTDEAVRYSGLPKAVLVDLAERGYIRRLEYTQPFRYERTDLEKVAMDILTPVLLPGRGGPKAVHEAVAEYQRAVSNGVIHHDNVLLDTVEKVDDWNARNPGTYRRIGDMVQVPRRQVCEPYCT